LERCNAGDLKDYVRIHPDAFGEKAGLKVVGEGLFKALAYIHDIDILHRDVKAENVGLHHPPGNNIPDRACLMDFGIACHMSESERINSRCGSPGSIAPEVIIHANQSPKADVFGGGVALFYALGEQVPFEKGDLKTTLKRNARAIIKFNERLRQMANGTQELLRSLLLRNPQVRPTAVEAIASIKKLVEGLPSRHGGNEDEPNPEPPLLRESTQPPRVINVPPLDNAPNETCQMVFLPLPGHLKPLSPQASPPLRRRPVLHPVKFLSTPASPPSMQEDCANDDAVESRTCRRKRPQSAGVTLYQPMATGQTLRSSEVVTKP
jgi:serine/threonine protein kinase